MASSSNNLGHIGILPLEIRNCIYEYTVCWLDQPRPNPSQKFPLGILRANRSFYDQIVPFLYKGWTLTFACDSTRTPESPELPDGYFAFIEACIDHPRYGSFRLPTFSGRLDTASTTYASTTYECDHYSVLPYSRLRSVRVLLAPPHRESGYLVVGWRGAKSIADILEKSLLDRSSSFTSTFYQPRWNYMLLVLK
ncbi:MAG: hypothetical protein Q9159_000353 [Coniocarpon cinnabarinum]